jgi:hypothetical protein
MTDLIILHDAEIDAVAGGPAWAVYLAIAVGAGAAATAANAIITAGGSIHDAVCVH